MHYRITDDDAPSRATYTAVAAARDCDPIDLPPLAWTVDVDALDAFAEAADEDVAFFSAFEYAGCSVTVTDAAVDVTVTDADAVVGTADD